MQSTSQTLSKPAAQNSPREITARGIILGIFLAVILAASNTYLALKIGILTSASIPAAVLAMGILRFFKGSNILENNLVQTTASAGEAIAGGIVYTIPALIIIRYWTHFSYLHNMAIALIGGIFGVLFSVPLRRVLIYDHNLRFPEAQAISKVLQLQESGGYHLRKMLAGGLIGAGLEFAQSGLQIIASSIQGWFAIGRTLVGFGAGFSATLIGAGYLMGFNVGISILLGAITGWLVLVPILSGVYHLGTASGSATQTALDLWSHYVRYIGIGSILTAGIWTLLTLLQPIWAGIYASIKALSESSREGILRTERDLPMQYVLIGIIICTIACFWLLSVLLPIHQLGLPQHFSPLLLIGSLLFVVIIGFLFAAITGYFSGLVGVSASPGSAIVIGGLLISALVLRTLMASQSLTMTSAQVTNACAIIIVIIAIVTGIAAITNDNMQDLKVGQLVGSTPWKQQLMLLIGVVAASAIVPVLMQLLFTVYGIGGVFPHPGMDPNKVLAAPVPSVLATVTQAVFDRALPVNMLLIGAGITIFFIILSFVLRRYSIRLSTIGVAMGLYLPLSSSTPLFFGSLFALLVQRQLRKKNLTETNAAQHGILLACGLVAGAALMDVLLAIPFALSGNPNVLNILPPRAQPIAMILGIFCVFGLGWMFAGTSNLGKLDNFKKT